MTQGFVRKTIESNDYDFVLINGLKEENSKLKDAVNEVLDLLNDTKGVPNTEWIKNRLTEATK